MVNMAERLIDTLDDKEADFCREMFWNYLETGSIGRTALEVSGASSGYVQRRLDDVGILRSPYGRNSIDLRRLQYYFERAIETRLPRAAVFREESLYDFGMSVGSAGRVENAVKCMVKGETSGIYGWSRGVAVVLYDDDMVLVGKDTTSASQENGDYDAWSIPMSRAGPSENLNLALLRAIQREAMSSHAVDGELAPWSEMVCEMMSKNPISFMRLHHTNVTFDVLALPLPDRTGLIFDSPVLSDLELRSWRYLASLEPSPSLVRTGILDVMYGYSLWQDGALSGDSLDREPHTSLLNINIATL